MTDNLLQSATRKNLRQLSAIRSIAFGGQLTSLVFFSQVQPIGLPFTILSAILALYGLVILMIWRRCFWAQPISEFEFFGHIVTDILFFSVLLFYSGGGSNPFVFYFLVPLSVSAATLPWRFTLSAAILSLGAYSLLLKYHVPIPALRPGHHAGASADLHILGMWLNFCLSAALITYFVTRMSAELRLREQAIAQQREDRLVDEQVLGIATLAAGTAHQLGTPLNTMKILLEELKAEPLTGQASEDIKLLEQQLEQCRSTLQQLVKTAGETSIDAVHQVPLRQYFSELLEHWQLLRPKVSLDLSIAASAPAISARLHPTISQALVSLLNNAADASPEKIAVTIDWDQRYAHLEITDYGDGIPAEIRKGLNKPFTSSKPEGMGLGLFLTKATLNRFGGEVILRSSPQGTKTTVTFRIGDD